MRLSKFQRHNISILLSLCKAQSGDSHIHESQCCYRMRANSFDRIYELCSRLGVYSKLKGHHQMSSEQIVANFILQLAGVKL